MTPPQRAAGFLVFPRHCRRSGPDQMRLRPLRRALGSPKRHSQQLFRHFPCSPRPRPFHQGLSHQGLSHHRPSRHRLSLRHRPRRLALPPHPKHLLPVQHRREHFDPFPPLPPVQLHGLHRVPDRVTPRLHRTKSIPRPIPRSYSNYRQQNISPHRLHCQQEP